MDKKKERSKKSIPVNESKADRFVRVVTPRIARAIKAITVIGYCASSVYEYKPEQVAQIQLALTEALALMKDRFSSKKAVGTEFKFR